MLVLGGSKASSARAELAACLLEEVWASALATLSTLAATVCLAAPEQRDSSNPVADSGSELSAESDSDSAGEQAAAASVSPLTHLHSSNSPQLRVEHALRRGFLLLARASCDISDFKQVV